jgi:hypothetical protein
MLSGSDSHPCWGDRSFHGDFLNEILHQETFRPATADPARSSPTGEGRALCRHDGKHPPS